GDRSVRGVSGPLFIYYLELSRDINICVLSSAIKLFTPWPTSMLHLLSSKLQCAGLVHIIKAILNIVIFENLRSHTDLYIYIYKNICYVNFLKKKYIINLIILKDYM